MLRLIAAALCLAGCYDAPKPPCGFRCGPSEACPADYACATDGVCHLHGAPLDLVCATPDAAPPDAYSPAVVFTNPTAEATVDPATTIEVGFDVDVAGVSSTTFTVTDMGTTMPVTGAVSYDASTRRATFERANGLPQRAVMVVALSEDIRDAQTDRPLMPTSFKFLTGPDTTPPMIIGTDPLNGAVGVPVATTVRFFFNEPVFNVYSPNVVLLDGATLVPATVSYMPATFEGIIEPTRQLLPNHTYTARVTTGVNDGGVNPLPATFDLTFTTGADTIAPQVVDTIPLDGDVQVPVGMSIRVVFDEPVVGADATSVQVNGGAIAGTITLGLAGRQIVFNPTVDLPAASTITVTLSPAITDAFGNSITPLTFSFTTDS
jgi:hypothetical protein